MERSKINAVEVERIRAEPPLPYKERTPVNRVIAVHGRKTAKPRPFPVNVTMIGGRLYLCSSTRRRDWVRNLLATGGCVIEGDEDGPRHPVLVEGREAAGVLAAYLSSSGYQDPELPFAPDASPEEILPHTTETAVFRLDPVRYFPGRDGVRLAYRELAHREPGEGRPVVLLHGYLANAGWSWSRLAPELAARGRRVIMPDLRGHGDSAKPHDPDAYPRDVLVDDGLALVEHLELTDYDLVGYSFGGRTAVRMLARGATPARAVVAGQGLEAVLHSEGRGSQYRDILARLASGGPPAPEARWLVNLGADPRALLLVLDSFINTTREELARVTVPTLVVTGDGDGHNETAPALAEALGNARYLEVPGDHVRAASAPEFHRAIFEFLG
jgi:pimeloyl-ACP methyl ester carboxylesterase